MKEKIEQTGKDSGKKMLLLFIGGMLFLDLLFLGFAMWRYELWWSEIAVEAAVFVLLGGVFAFRLREVIPERFFWLLGLHLFELAVIAVSYEAEGTLRPVLAVPLLLGVIAGREAGMFALIFYGVVSALVCADPTEILLLYLAAGLIGMCLIAGKTKLKEYLIGAAGFFIGYVAVNVLVSFYAYSQIQPEDLLYGVIGGALQVLPVLCFLPFLIGGGLRLSGTVSLSAAVNLEFPALAEFSEREPVLFKHSRLVARLSSQAAAEIGADTLLAEAGGLYHEIGKGLGEDCDKESLKICKKHKIPASVQDIVKEHNPDNKTPSSKESAIVMISDTIISVMEQNRKRNLSQNENMEEVITRAFKVREDSGAFLLSGLSENELANVKEFYIRTLSR